MVEMMTIWKGVLYTSLYELILTQSVMCHYYLPLTPLSTQSTKGQSSRNKVYISEGNWVSVEIQEESLRSSAPRRADPSSLWPDDWGGFAGMESFSTACQRRWVTSPWRITFTAPYARTKHFSGLHLIWQIRAKIAKGERETCETMECRAINAEVSCTQKKREREFFWHLQLTLQ